MTATVPYTPAGYHSVIPYLYIDGAGAALEFYKKALGAKVELSMPRPDGKIMHAEMRIGDSVVMLADENEELKAFGPHHYGGVAGSLMVYLPDVDATFNQAVAAGATIERPLADQFYGDRTGGIVDPFGHHWYLATHVRDVGPEEIKQAMAAMAK
jgi:PhnB protein